MNKMGEKINFKAKYFEGSFDLDVAEMLCLPYQKYNDVELCFKPEANTMNFLFATIDKMIPYDDAVKFGKEIEKRYNGYPDLKKENENLKKIVNEIKDSLYGRKSRKLASKRRVGTFRQLV